MTELRTLERSGSRPAISTGTGDRTIITTASERVCVRNVHGSSVTGGAILILKGSPPVNLGTIPAGGRIDVEFPDGVVVSDLGFDVVLDGPADFVGSIIGYFVPSTV